jgi:hypothetical protein
VDFIFRFRSGIVLCNRNALGMAHADIAFCGYFICKSDGYYLTQSQSVQKA